MPSVITHEDDEGIIGQSQIIQLIQNQPDLCVDEADTGIIGMPRFTVKVVTVNIPGLCVLGNLT